MNLQWSTTGKIIAPPPAALLSEPQRIKEQLGLRQRVFSDIETLGPLKGTAWAIIDYVYGFASPIDDPSAPYFKKKTDWVLEPDEWIVLTFTYKKGSAITVSVGVPHLCARPDLELKSGRWPQWTKFTIRSVRQLPSAMLYIEEAYYESVTGYRKIRDKPKRPAA
jgi:hypothetical protein